jgi:hypothetical protein
MLSSSQLANDQFRMCLLSLTKDCPVVFTVKPDRYHGSPELIVPHVLWVVYQYCSTVQSTQRFSVQRSTQTSGVKNLRLRLVTPSAPFRALPFAKHHVTFYPTFHSISRPSQPRSVPTDQDQLPVMTYSTCLQVETSLFHNPYFYHSG